MIVRKNKWLVEKRHLRATMKFEGNLHKPMAFSSEITARRGIRRKWGTEAKQFRASVMS